MQRRTGVHHLDGAAGQAERDGPERTLAAPVDQVIHFGDDVLWKALGSQERTCTAMKTRRDLPTPLRAVALPASRSWMLPRSAAEEDVAGTADEAQRTADVRARAPERRARVSMVRSAASVCGGRRSILAARFGGKTTKIRGESDDVEESSATGESWITVILRLKLNEGRDKIAKVLDHRN
jgi:hypothetical protein